MKITILVQVFCDPSPCVCGHTSGRRGRGGADWSLLCTDCQEGDYCEEEQYSAQEHSLPSLLLEISQHTAWHSLHLLHLPPALLVEPGPGVEQVQPSHSLIISQYSIFRMLSGSYCQQAKLFCQESKFSSKQCNVYKKISLEIATYFGGCLRQILTQDDEHWCGVGPVLHLPESEMQMSIEQVRGSIIIISIINILLSPFRPCMR